MPDEIVDSIKFAFGWRKGAFAKLYAYLALVGLVWFFAEEFFKTKLDWMALLQLPSAPLAGAFAAFVLLLLLSASVELLVLEFALKSRKIKTRKLAMLDFITYFFLDLAVIVAAAISAFNPRGLAVLAGLVLVSLAAAVTGHGALWAIAGILFAAYVFVFVYNMLRLSQTQFFFAWKERDLVSALGNSLSATFGNVLWLVFVNIGVFVGVGLVLLVVVGIPTLLVSFSAGGFESFPSRIVSTLLSPLMVFSFLFAGTSIFSVLLKRRKRKADWNF